MTTKPSRLVAAALATLALAAAAPAAADAGGARPQPVSDPGGSGGH
jgi:hypothetical protein